MIKNYFHENNDAQVNAIVKRIKLKCFLKCWLSIHKKMCKATESLFFTRKK